MPWSIDINSNEVSSVIRSYCISIDSPWHELGASVVDGPRLGLPDSEGARLSDGSRLGDCEIEGTPDESATSIAAPSPSASWTSKRLLCRIRGGISAERPSKKRPMLIQTSNLILGWRAAFGPGPGGVGGHSYPLRARETGRGRRPDVCNRSVASVTRRRRRAAPDIYLCGDWPSHSPTRDGTAPS